MRHRKHRKILSRDSAAKKALLRDLMTSLILHDRIRTTEAKARVLRPQIERLVTHARTGSLTARRRVLQSVRTSAAAQRMMATIAPRFAKRNGGYTRIIKVGPRAGDGAHMVQIEFLAS